MENTLIINCSNGMRLSFVNDNTFETFIDEQTSRHSDDILMKIDELLSKCGVKIKDVKKICVCVGPGSFTGVRVAISVCKGLAIGLGAKIFVLSNFDIFDINEKNYYLVLEAFSNYVYFRRCLNGKILDQCVDVVSLKNQLDKNNFNIYCENEKVQNLLNINKIYAKIVKNNEINSFLKISNDKAIKQISKILPVYLRASQAEIEREKKLKQESK